MTRLPDLFIVGAPKCGTTSAYEWLKGHPEVYMAPIKEPSYYARDVAADEHSYFLRYDLDRARYLALFDAAGNAKRVGEASTRYLHSTEAPRLIAAEQPGAYIVGILRNPVDMIASLHAYKVAVGAEDLARLEDALAVEDDRRSGRQIPQGSNPNLATYRDRARFGEQLARWFDAFGRDRIHVIVFEEMVGDPALHFRRLLEFLKVDPDYQPSFRAHTPAHLARAGLASAVRRSRPVQFLAWRALPRILGDARTFALAGRVGQGRLQRSHTDRALVSSRLRERLQVELEPDVAHLSRLLGRDMLSLWFGGT